MVVLLGSLVLGYWVCGTILFLSATATFWFSGALLSDAIRVAMVALVGSLWFLLLIVIVMVMRLLGCW